MSLSSCSIIACNKTRWGIFFYFGAIVHCVTVNPIKQTICIKALLGFDLLPPSVSQQIGLSWDPVHQTPEEEAKQSLATAVSVTAFTDFTQNVSTSATINK